MEFKYSKKRIDIDQSTNTITSIGGPMGENSTLIGSWINSTENKSSTLTVKISKQRSHIGIGVVTADCDVNSYLAKCKNSIVYFSDSEIWTKGAKSSNAVKWKEGDIVSLTLDLISGSLLYDINNGEKTGKITSEINIVKCKWAVTLWKKSDSLKIISIDTQEKDKHTVLLEV